MVYFIGFFESKNLIIMLFDLLKEKIMLEILYWNINLVYKGEINCLGFLLLEINYEYICIWMLILKIS